MNKNKINNQNEFSLKKIKNDITFAASFFNTISKLAFACGFIVLASYFISIGYIPVGNYESLFNIVLTLAFLSVYFIFFLAFTFIFAPLTWAQLLKNIHTCTIIVGKEQAEHVVSSFKTQHIDITSHARRRIFLWYIVSLLVCFLIVGLLYWWVGDKIAPAIGLCSFACFLLSQLGSKANYDKLKTSAKKAFWYKIAPYINISLVTGGVFLFLLLVFNIIILLYTHNGQTEHSAFNLFIYGLFILTASAICFIPPNPKWKSYLWMPTVGIGFVFIILFLTQSYTSTVNLLIRSLKIGAMYDVTVDADQKGCIFLAKKGIDTTCEDKDLNTVKHINVYWRAGEYYLGYKTSTEEIYFNMPAHYDLSITTKNKLKFKSKN